MGSESSRAEEPDEATLGGVVDYSPDLPTVQNAVLFVTEKTITAKIAIKDNQPEIPGKSFDLNGIFKSAVGMEIFTQQGWTDRHGNQLFKITQYTSIDRLGFDQYELTITFVKGEPIVREIPVIRPSLN